jgi:hypothetical protein
LTLSCYVYNNNINSLQSTSLTFGDNNLVLKLNNGMIVNQNATIGATKEWKVIGQLSTPFIYISSNNGHITEPIITIGNITLGSSPTNGGALPTIILSPLPNDGNIRKAIVINHIHSYAHSCQLAAPRY